MPSNRALRAMQRAAQQPQRRKKYIKPMFESNKWKVLRGDEVMVMAGKDRGTTGTVLQVLRDKSRPRVVVEGRNLCLKTEMTDDGPTRLSVEAPLHHSNVQLLDPQTKKPVRIGYRFLDDGTKVRFTRGRHASGSIVPKSDVLKQRKSPRPALPGAPRPSPGPADAAHRCCGEKDTPAEEAARVSYTAADYPAMLRRAAAADAVRQYGTWLGRAGGAPGGALRASPLAPEGVLRGAAWAGLRRRWRGFAAAAA